MSRGRLLLLAAVAAGMVHVAPDASAQTGAGAAPGASANSAPAASGAGAGSAATAGAPFAGGMPLAIERPAGSPPPPVVPLPQSPAGGSNVPDALADPVLADPVLAGPHGFDGRIESIERVPGGSFAALQLRGSSQLYFVSGNGRFVVRGELYDIWQGRPVQSVAELRDAAATVNLKGFAGIWPSLMPFTLGTGKLQEVVFVDPYCPYCAKLLTQIQALAAEGSYQFLIVPVPLLGQRSVDAVRNLVCAQDQAAAAQALLLHQYDPPPAQAGHCDPAPLNRRLVLARLLQIDAVPFVIRSDGRTVTGLPPDFLGFLRGAS